MGITYKIDVNAGIIYAVASGTIGVKEVESFRERLLSDPQYRPDADGIVDFENGQFLISGSEAQQLAIWASRKKPVKRLALIMGPKSYGFGRMYQGWASDGQDVKIFEDKNSAKEWLDLPPEEKRHMGISYKIDVAEGIIYSIAEGTIRAEDVQTYRKNLMDDPKFRPGLGEIVEYRMAEISVSDEEIKTLASNAPVGRSRKLALVVDGPKERFLQLFKVMVRDVAVEVFNDIASAREWIGLPPEEE